MPDFRFGRPVPGQSLTSEPGKYPFERPPEINDPEEALMHHLLRLSEPKVMKSAFQALETGIDLVTLVEGLMRNAVSSGLHSIDVSMIVAPTVHEYIKDTADAIGIDYEEGLEDEEDGEATYRTNRLVALRKLKKVGITPPSLQEVSKEKPKDNAKVKESSQLSFDFEDQEEEEEKPMMGKGLMSREV